MGVFDAGSIMAHLQMDRSGFAGGIIEAQGLTSLLGSSISSFLANPLLGVANLAKEAFGAIKDLVVGTADAADQFAKMSRATGISIEFLSGLDHAAALSGVAVEGLRPAFDKLIKGLSDARRGTGEALPAFEKLGIAAVDGAGDLRDAQEVFLEIADAIAALPGPSEQAAAAMQIFGESGGKMVPLLAEGAAGIGAMVAEAGELGLTFDQQTAASAERFNDSLTRLKGVFGGLARQLAAPIFEALAPGIEAVTALLTPLVKVLAKIIELATAPLRLFGGALDALMGNGGGAGGAGAGNVVDEVGAAMRVTAGVAAGNTANRIRSERDRAAVEMAIQHG